MLKLVYYPAHIVKNGIGKNHKGVEGGWNIGAFDTETVRGFPNTLQFSFTGKDVIVCKVTPDDIFDHFLLYVDAWAKGGMLNVLYAHNLKFDLQSILHKKEHREFFGLARRDFIIPIRRKDGEPPATKLETDLKKSPDEIYASYMQAFTDKTWFAKLKLSDRRRVAMCDTNAFFKMSLAEAANMVDSPVPKLDRPKDLGNRNLSANPEFVRWVKRRMRVSAKKGGIPPAEGRKMIARFTKREAEQFEKYIRGDARAQWYVGAAVYQLHQDHDVKMSVSLPQLAGRILRHRFFDEHEAIKFPPMDLVRTLELSYHGGKNGMIRNDDGTWKSGYYKRVWEVDINSAYTSAMVSLPGFIDGEWKSVDAFVPGSDGVYTISGEVNCPYGCVFSHDFSRIEGPFRDIAITSYELESGLATGCIRLTKCQGSIWIDRSKHSPIRDFALYFWEEKAKWTKIEGKRGFHTLMSKLYPNSTYGKMVSTILDPDASEISMDADYNVYDEKVYRACGLYNPAIASLITGRVRGTYLHTHEHKWKSIHSSTDSIKTQTDPTGDPDIGKGLGQWSIEIVGPCCMIRPKLYIHESESEFATTKLGEPVFDKRGRRVRKIKDARHGFRGKVEELLAAVDWEHQGEKSPILHGREFNYFATQVWTARQSLIRTKKTVVPLNFERVPVSLKPALGLGPRIAPGI